jgi:flagellar assembly factor FliW
MSASCSPPPPRSSRNTRHGWPALAEPLGSDEVDLLVILTVGAALAEATANLRAPVALARATNRAVQVILDDDRLSMHEPLLSQ